LFKEFSTCRLANSLERSDVSTITRTEAPLCCAETSRNLGDGNKIIPMMPSHVDPMHFVAAHEAGHAVANILAHRALGRDYPSFDRIFIRRDFRSPYIDQKNREVNCIGMCEGPALYTPGIGLHVFHANPLSRPTWRAEILTTMKWSIVISFAGPFAAAFSRNYRSRRDKRWTALLSCGASEDYRQAEAVLADYKEASKRRYGIRHFEERAWDLVGANQPAISALASKLLQYETLEYKEAHGIVVPYVNQRSVMTSGW
jgi:hypothetical protein